jgi:GNAT superfamily N-acetyltransferase
MTAGVIRPGSAGDIPAMQDIERSAGELFRDLGMTAVAEDEPAAVADLAQYVDDGRAWVLVLEGALVGYLLVDVVDGTAHIEQVSVRAGDAGHGYGRRLIDTAIGWARQRGYPSVTLTTFTEVPWNGPYYRRLGFRPIPDDEITRGLHALRQHEAQHGLDQWPRECLWLELG